MARFEVRNLSFSYPKIKNNALSDISLSIGEGEILLLCGISGCGKSTLLKHFKSVFTPYGERSGKIFMDGKELHEYSSREQASRIGYVFQNPDDQIVTDKVWHELAFGLESLGANQRTMRLRVAEMASYFGMESLFYKNVSELSGGQKQLLNLASVMSMNPDTLILDEPTSQLDPIAAADFLQTVKKINMEFGVTIIMSEHRLEDALPLSDKTAVLENGHLLICDTTNRVASALKDSNAEMFAAMPTPVKVRGAISYDGEYPLTVNEGRQMLLSLPLKRELLPGNNIDIKHNEKALSLFECWFRYEKDGDDILKGLSLDLYPGEIYGLVGGNGSGKSTTISVICGINKVYRGKISVNGMIQKSSFCAHSLRIAALCQDPRALFTKDTVESDLYEMFDGIKITENEKLSKMQEVIEKMEVKDFLAMHPFDLSGGEQQRVAIAKVLLSDPKILLLDEPTKGMDVTFKTKFGQQLRALCTKGISVMLVSHDIEFCAKFSDRVGLLFDGGIVSENAPREFFCGNSFYTTAANRMARHVFPNAVLTEEVSELCLKQLQEK